MTEREIAEYISTSGKACSGNQKLNCPNCILDRNSCGGYYDRINQAKQWIKNNQKHKLTVTEDNGDYKVELKQEEKATLMTYADKLEKDCKYINDRLEKRESELMLQDEKGLIAHYIDGKIEVMPNTLSYDRSKVLNKWLTKLLKEV